MSFPYYVTRSNYGVMISVRNYVQNHGAQTFAVVYTLSFHEERWLDVPFTLRRVVDTQSSQTERTFNRVLTQLDRDGGSRFRSSRTRSSCGIYGVTQRSECEGSPCEALVNISMMRCTLRFTSLLNRRRVTRVYGQLNSAAPH